MVKKLLKNNPTNTKEEIDKLLSKGAPVKEDEVIESKKNQRVMINLRMPIDLLKDVDEALKHRVGISRTGWILEAIHEKIKNLRNI